MTRAPTLCARTHNEDTLGETNPKCRSGNVIYETEAIYCLSL